MLFRRRVHNGLRKQKDWWVSTLETLVGCTWNSSHGRHLLSSALILKQI
jgi:hypothetical protein